jgi:hypothetical protein
MVDSPALAKLLAALGSTECLAAFLGAFAAFMLEALRRWRSDRLANVATGKEAVLSLAQMYSHITAVSNQQFADQRKAFEENHGRQPNYVEILPLEANLAGALRLQPDRLGFLISSHDPDLLNRLVAVDHFFGVLVSLLERRNEAHLEWQRKSFTFISTTRLPDPISFEAIETGAGMDLSRRLKQMTEELESGLPESSRQLQIMAKQLTDVLSLMYPTKSATSLGVSEVRKTDVTTPPANAKPRLWRKVVRYISRKLRRRIF